MSSSISLPRVVAFGDFELDTAAHMLRKQGRHLHLQEQSYKVLVLLLERAGEVVTRDEFRRTLWPGSVVVDFDHGLNNAVARLREALGDGAEKPNYIETLPRIGYRWLSPVAVADREHSEPEPEAPEVDPPPDSNKRRAARVAATPAILLVAAVIVTIAATSALLDRDDSGRARPGVAADRPAPALTADAPVTPDAAPVSNAPDRSARASADPEAQRLYDLGRTMLLDGSARRDRDGARRLLEQAIARDPEFAAAHAALAVYYFSLAWSQVSDIEASVKLGRLAAERAYALDPSLPDALRSRADYELWQYRFRGDYAAYLSGLADYRRAIAADANRFPLYFSYGRCVLWMEPELTVELLRNARRIDPMSHIAVDMLASAHLVRGRLDEVRAQCRSRVPPAADRQTCELVGYTAASYLGRLDEMVARVERLRTGQGMQPRIGDDLGARLQLWAGYLSLGDQTAADRVADFGATPAAAALGSAARLIGAGRAHDAFEALDRRRDEFPESHLLDLPAARLALIAGEPARAAELLEVRLPDLVSGIEPINFRNLMPALDLVAAWLQTGRRTQAMALLERAARFLDSAQSSPLPMFRYQRARAHALASERELALRTLDQAYAAGFRTLWAVDLMPQPLFYIDPVALDPAFERMRSDPGLREWLDRVQADNARQLARLRQGGGDAIPATVAATG